MSGESVLPISSDNAHHAADKCRSWVCESDSAEILIWTSSAHPQTDCSTVKIISSTHWNENSEKSS